MYGIVAGSISPVLVPITNPDSGVNPIDVSNDLPFLIAQIEAPFPMWHEIVFNSLGSFPRISATFSPMYL